MPVHRSMHTRLRSQFFKLCQRPCAAGKPVCEEFREVFEAVALGVLLHRRGCGFERVQVFMRLREAHCAIEEVSELVQDGAGLGNVDPLLRVDRSADAVDAELLTEVCEVFCADYERPAVFVKSVKDRLWNFAEFQQECVHIPLRQVFDRDRRIGRYNGQRLCQNGMKKLCGFGACNELRCGLVLSTKSKRFSDAQSIFTVGQPVQTVKRRVVERNFHRCGR